MILDDLDTLGLRRGPGVDHTAAEAIGVPAAQLVRWILDGTIDEDEFIGSRWAAERARFTLGQCETLRERLTNPEV